MVRERAEVDGPHGPIRQQLSAFPHSTMRLHRWGTFGAAVGHACLAHDLAFTPMSIHINASLPHSYPPTADDSQAKLAWLLAHSHCLHTVTTPLDVTSTFQTATTFYNLLYALSSILRCQRHSPYPRSTNRLFLSRHRCAVFLI